MQGRSWVRDPDFSDKLTAAWISKAQNVEEHCATTRLCANSDPANVRSHVWQHGDATLAQDLVAARGGGAVCRLGHNLGGEGMGMGLGACLGTRWRVSARTRPAADEAAPPVQASDALHCRRRRTLRPRPGPRSGPTMRGDCDTHTLHCRSFALSSVMTPPMAAGMSTSHGTASRFSGGSTTPPGKEARLWARGGAVSE